MSVINETEDTLGDVQDWKQTADLVEGTRVGRYQVLGLLGKGGMGAVYKAYDPELDRSIAIKILPVKPQEGESASRPQARLMREAQALAKLSHPNVVSVFDVGTYAEGVYIAMEYVKGKTLREWLRADKPIRKEIINTLLEAGQGLHAAHHEGIVHRDFKPDNVLIGDKGQVKVLDFGLARAAGSEETIVPHDELAHDQQLVSSDKLLSTPLTRVGAIVGTAVYMAPEHFAFQELDEKTDQFSFCVTLFEALYGMRPFSGKTAKELAGNITSGRIEFPPETNVPKWMEQIILKGISISKDDRYVSMLELLDALGNDPEIARARRRKKIQSTSLILLLTVLTLGFGYYAFFKKATICTGAEKKGAGIWNEKIKEKISQAFAKTNLSYANDSFLRVTEKFDDYLKKWRKEYTETCQATRMRGEQSVEIMDLKMVCLNKHLRNAAALVNVLSEADKTVVAESVQAASSLSGFSNCHDVDILRSTIPPPQDEATKNKVAAIRLKLAKVEALSKTGKYREGLELVKTLEQSAKKLAYRPIQAEVLYWLGFLFEKSGKYEDAESALRESAIVAGDSRDAFLSAQVMVLLVRVVGYKQARHEAGLWLARNADVMIRVAGGDDITRALLHDNLGVVFADQGNYETAQEQLYKELLIIEKVYGPDHPLVANSLNNLGGVFMLQGEFTKAIQHYKRALIIRENALGANHPVVAESLNNLGVLLKRQGDYDKALEYYSRALRIHEDVLGPEHPVVAVTLFNIGLVVQDQGDYDKALDYYSKSLAIRKKALGPTHPSLAWPLSLMGIVLLEKGQFDKALGFLEHTVSLCEINTCQAEPRAIALFALARALVATTRNKERAVRLARQAHEIFRKTPKPFKTEIHEVTAWLKEYARDRSKAISAAKR